MFSVELPVRENGQLFTTHLARPGFNSMDVSKIIATFATGEGLKEAGFFTLLLHDCCAN